MISLLVPLALAAGEADFAAANTALAAGDLPGAEAGFRAALSAGAVDADVYYNLGNVLYREGELPLALLSWRRSLALSPRDPDAEANLAFARRAVTDDVVSPDPYPAWAPWQAALTADEGIAWGGLLVGLGLLAVAARSRLPGLPLVQVGIGLSVLGLGLGAGGAGEAQLPSGAVVLVDELQLQSDLGGGVVLLTLHAGAELAVLEESGDRLLLELPDGRKGWAAAAAVGRIDPFAPMPSAAAGP